VLVEFALVGPLLFLMIIGLLDFSLIIVGNTVGTNAAREGARVGVIDYIDADDDVAPVSASYQAVVDAVTRRLAGLVRSDLVIKVRCVDGDEPDPHDSAGTGALPLPGTIPCTSATAVPGHDLLEVAFSWSHLGASPFVANTKHSERAMFTIQGKAAYSPAGAATSTTLVAPTSSTASTTTTSTTTTSTLPGATTTTTLPVSTTTTTPVGCSIASFTTSRLSTSIKIFKNGAKTGQVTNSPGALGVTVSAPGCAAGSVNLRVAGAPTPYGAGVAMDFVSSGSFSYQVGGSNWATGTYIVTIRTVANTKTFNLTVG
jgi:hypothetical protein